MGITPPLPAFWIVSGNKPCFFAHDAGNFGKTHNVVIDTIFGVEVADLGCGLSIRWWKSTHNIHHFVSNHPVRDSSTVSLTYY
jgi:delta8-fatty-acid desaturase